MANGLVRTRGFQLGLLLGAVVLGPANASADVLPLASLERRALETSLALDAREARADAAAARIDALRAEGRPRLTFDVAATVGPGARVLRLNCDPTDPSDDGEKCYVSGNPSITNASAFVPYARWTAGLRFEGVLYDFGRTRARVTGGRAEAAATESEIHAQEEMIVRAVRASYLEWYGAYAARRFTEDALAAATARVASVEGALGHGARSPYDLDTARLEAARIRLELSRALAEETEARLQVAHAVGEPLPDDAEPDPAVVETTPAERSEAGSRAARVLELRRDAVRAAERLYRLRYAPVLTTSVQLGIAQQITVDANPVFPGYQVQLGLSVPLWDPRVGAHLVSEARAQAAALEASAEDANRTMRAQEQRARAAYENALREVELAHEVVALARRSAEGAEERWRIAGGSIDAVLAARERERRASEELVRAQVTRTEAALRLVPIATH